MFGRCFAPCFRQVIVMKRLWVRLSAVVGVVALLGGGGYYFTRSGTAANEAGAEDTEIAKNEGSTPVTPVKDNLEGGAPAFDAYPSTPAENGGYGGDLHEPAQATWQDQPSQPIIRQVSGDEPEAGHEDANYRVGDAPPAAPVAVYGHDASPAGEGDRFSQPTPASGAYDRAPDYGGAGYAAEGDRAPVAASPDYPGTPDYPATAGATDAIADDTGHGATGYGPAVPAVPPAGSLQDFSQPVSAPGFANGESVGSSNPAPADYGAPPADYTNPPVDSASLPAPRFDSPPSPQFDAVPPATQPPATQPTTQPPAYNPVPAYNPAPAIAAAGAAGAGAGAAAAAALVAGTPGDRSLDGRQTPAITMEKMAPAEIQVGKPAAFKTLVRNSGQATAMNVVVTDRVPQGTQLVDATPQPSQAADGSLVWQFDTLAPGEEVLISMEVMPQAEGEIGSQALVTFQAQASVRTVCTKPQLLVEHSTNPKVLIGENVVFTITISNPGSGDTTGIVLEEDVPKGLTHAAGGELEFEVGTLRPGESRRLELVLKASEAGVTNNTLRVRADANLLAEHTAQLEVIAPKLLVELTGPRRRYLDREVKYQVAFGNAGTALAKNIELATYLPKGLKFVSTTGKGQYDARDHAVYWSLDQLAPGQEGTVELTTLPIATGELKLQLEGTADLGLSANYEHTTVVEGITELVFTVSDTQDPIEVGSETTYLVSIVNKGSKAATNVRVIAVLPAELTPLSGEGTTRVAVEGQQVVMEPIERMGQQDEAVYKIKVKGLRAGDHLVDVRLVCDEVPAPVTKQESTKVYADGL